MRRTKITEQKTKIFLAPAVRSIRIVGCGGTGSYLAQGLAKLLAGYGIAEMEVKLVDPDVVEEKNCKRQNFKPWEVGMNKAEALALRLSEEFGNEADDGQNASPRFVAYPCLGEKVQSSYGELIITCVDNISARKHYRGSDLWMDLGNGVSQGQVIFGTAQDERVIQSELNDWKKTPIVKALPNPYLKTGLKKLKDKKTKKRAVSCADMPFDEQGIFVNELAAQAGLNILHQILVKGTVSCPAIYFDAEYPRMIPAAITKEYMTL